MMVLHSANSKHIESIIDCCSGKMISEEEQKGLQLGEGKPYVGYVKDSDYYFDGYSHFSIH